MKVIPSVDISEGRAVKRVKGVRGTGLVLGDPVKVAEEIYSMGYRYLHVVDLDAAEGVGNNRDKIREIMKLGFDWVQVGGGVRDLKTASELISLGASAVVMSTLPFTDPKEFSRVKSALGGDKIMVSIDYDSQGFALVKGWKERAMTVKEALELVRDVKGVILTFVDKEGTSNGIDSSAGEKVRGFNGLKEYAGGISGLKDLLDLRAQGFDGAIVGMSFYTGKVRGVVEV